MPKFQQLCLLAFLLFSVAACSKKSENVNPDKIEVEYSLTYYSQSNQTTASAKFGYRSRTVKLTDGAYVRIDGFKPDFNTNNRNYTESYNYYKPSVSFEYLDNRDRTHTNQVEMTPAADYPNIFQFVSTNYDMPFYWNGDPLEVGENISLKIAAKATPDSSVTFTANAVGAQFMYISSATVRAKIPLGEATATLTRSRTAALQQGAATGGTIRTTYVNTRTVLVN
jgi:hypothetical protein